MTAFRLAALPVLLVALAGSVLAWRGADATNVLPVLSRHVGGGYLVVAYGLVAAPAVLVLALLVGRRSPWPWAATCALYLAGLVVAGLRLGDLLPASVWLLVAGIAVLAAASVAAGFDVDRARTAPEPAAPRP